MKIKEFEKISKYSNLAREQKTVKHEGSSDINCNWCVWNGHQRLGKKTGGTGNQRKNRDHLDHSSIKINSNTEKNPEYLRSFRLLWITTRKCWCCPVGWGCRIHKLRPCREVRPPNECPRYNTKQSDGKLSGMRTTPSVSSLPGLLWPRLVAPDRVQSMDPIELNCVLISVGDDTTILLISLSLYSRCYWYLYLLCFTRYKTDFMLTTRMYWKILVSTKKGVTYS